MPIRHTGSTNLVCNWLGYALAAAPFLLAEASGACLPPPPAVRDIAANSFYTDVHHSVIDPARHAQNAASVKPFEDFGRRVVAMANQPDADSKSCALQWLQQWAEGGAMLGQMASGQAYYEREWMLSELALSYAKAKPVGTPVQTQAIDAWLKTLGTAVVDHVDHKKGKHNNHYYWAGLAVAAAGRVTGDANLTAWGRKVFDEAMGQIEDDGTLPNEMDRARRALAYHLFAAEPLVMLAAILPADSPRLAKLVGFCLAAMADPSIVAKRTGFDQEAVKPGSYDWLAVYARRHPSPEIAQLLQSPGLKLSVSRLGGALAQANPLEKTLSP